jgi:hypothetical protein
MDDEAACNDDIREHLAITACLQKILDDAEEKKKRPRCGCSRPGRKKSKPRQRLEGHTMLYNKLLRLCNTCRKYSAAL